MGAMGKLATAGARTTSLQITGCIYPPMKTRLNDGGGKKRTAENWCAEFNEQQVDDIIPQLAGIRLLVEHDPARVIGRVLAAKKTHGAGINITAIVDVDAHPAARVAADQLMSGHFIGFSLAHRFFMEAGKGAPICTAEEASVVEFPGREGSNIHLCTPLAGVRKWSAAQEGPGDIYQQSGEITMVGGCKMSQLTANNPTTLAHPLPPKGGIAAVAVGAAPPVAVVASPVVAVEPPVAVVAPPVVEAAPPVVAVAPPVAVVAPPVVEAAPPVVEAAPPVVEAAPPVAAVAPPVAAVAPPVVAIAPPVVAIAPPVVAVAPPVVEAAPPVAESVQLLSKAARRIELMTKTIATQQKAAAAQTAAFALLEAAMATPTGGAQMQTPATHGANGSGQLATLGQAPRDESLLAQAAARLTQQASTIRRQESTINYTSGFSAQPAPESNMEGVCAASGTKRHTEDHARAEGDATFRTFYNDRVGDADATSRDMHRLFNEYKGNTRTGLVLASAKRQKRGTLLPDDRQAVDDGTEFVSAKDFCPELMEKIMSFSTGAAPSAEHVDELVKATHMC